MNERIIVMRGKSYKIDYEVGRYGVKYLVNRWIEGGKWEAGIEGIIRYDGRSNWWNYNKYDTTYPLHCGDRGTLE